MRYPHEITLKLTRNIAQAQREIIDRHKTVASDSVFGSDPEAAMMRHTMSSKRDDGSLYVILQWVFRDRWTPVNTFLPNGYERRSHKYWLRGLIRRCR